jgi:hypothetical protein
MLRWASEPTAVSAPINLRKQAYNLKEELSVRRGFRLELPFLAIYRRWI